MSTISSTTKPTLIVVLGPTTSGKSALAVALAQELDGEVISADSRQVYRGLDLGTGKITQPEMHNIPHHLLDVADPHDQFTVVEYKRLADEAIFDCIKRGKIPILCGGTGFYIESIVDDVTPPDVTPDAALRAELDRTPLEKLLAELKTLDPASYERIDHMNKRRVIRAIEIVRNLGNVPKIVKHERFTTIMIGLTLPDPILKTKIHDRLVARIDQGMIDEAIDLHAGDSERASLSYWRMNDLGLEYRYLAEHLQGHLTQDELITVLSAKCWQYARRQKTWFKADKRIHWFDATDSNLTELVVAYIQQTL